MPYLEVKLHIWADFGETGCPTCRNNSKGTVLKHFRTASTKINIKIIKKILRNYRKLNKSRQNERLTNLDKTILEKVAERLFRYSQERASVASCAWLK